jgi:glycosyltransferase involved in cell wall biosynthesis
MKQECAGLHRELKARGRILFVAPSAYPLGGVATWLDYIIPGLRNQGWDVILGLASGRRHDADVYIERHPMEGIERIDCNSGTLEARLRSLSRTIRRLQPDIAASVNIPDVYGATQRLRQKKECGTRAVMTLHALEPDYFEDIRGYNGTLDAVIATNRLAQALVEQRSGLESRRVFYAPYGVEDAPALPPQDCLGELRIAFVGRLASCQKRVEDIPLIAAGLAQRGVRCRWLIAGAGPQEDWLRQELCARAESGTVHFLGNLSGEELSSKVYQQADVLLITSSWETGPLVAWEAMAHGTAVASSSYVGAGIEDSLRHLENCMLFPVGDTNRAIQCLLMLRDANLRQRLAEAGSALIAKRYSREASIEAWSRCFADILRRPLRAPLPSLGLPRPRGRLDRLLGVQLGESVREMLGRRQSNAGADEWPHSHYSGLEDNATFLATAAQLDRPVRG